MHDQNPEGKEANVKFYSDLSLPPRDSIQGVEHGGDWHVDQ
jgi:hypothetical protein